MLYHIVLSFLNCLLTLVREEQGDIYIAPAWVSLRGDESICNVVSTIQINCHII